MYAQLVFHKPKSLKISTWVTKPHSFACVSCPHDDGKQQSCSIFTSADFILSFLLKGHGVEEKMWWEVKFMCGKTTE